MNLDNNGNGCNVDSRELSRYFWGNSEKIMDKILKLRNKFNKLKVIIKTKFWYLSHRQAAKAQSSPRSCAVSPES